MARGGDGADERVSAKDVALGSGRVIPVGVSVSGSVDSVETVDQGAELGRELVVGRVAAGPDWAGVKREGDMSAGEARAGQDALTSVTSELGDGVLKKGGVGGREGLVDDWWRARSIRKRSEDFQAVRGSDRTHDRSASRSSLEHLWS